MEEKHSFEEILERLLGQAAENFPELDTREGSLIHAALAPAAMELTKLYCAQNFALEMSFADTANRDYLIRRAAERGITPHPATFARIQAIAEPATVNIPLGSRFRAGELTFVVEEARAGGVLQLSAQTPGLAGNLSGGRLIPTGFIEGLQTVQVSALLIPGREEESTQQLRARYIAMSRAERFGGNMADYREKILSIDGVGASRIFPVFRGPGTVQVAVLGADFCPPSSTLVEHVQEVLDPASQGGQGRGWAPIGHQVEVVGASALKIAVESTLTVWHAADLERIQKEAQAACQAYFLELAHAWGKEEDVVVRIAQIETRMLDIEGVVDVRGTSLNGQGENLRLEALEIPQLSQINLR